MEDKNIKICPICNEKYDKKQNHCPKCLYKPPFNIIKALGIIIVVILPFVFLEIKNQSNYSLDKINETKQYITYHKEQKPDDFKIKIPLREMEDLSYKTKDEILAKRKEYVENSLIFNSIKNYKPNPEVYKIEDKLPWISAKEIAKYGINKSKDISKGPSRHSISINNPEILLSIITPDFGSLRDAKNFSEYDYFYPKAIYWSKKENKISIHFDIKNFYTINPNFVETFLHFDETNARDLGYNWIYAKNCENISFKNIKNNFSIEPYNIKGFYHKGLSCKKIQGCNNYSPYQEQLTVKIEDLPAKLLIKLWKNKPDSKDKKADILYEMVFE